MVRGGNMPLPYFMICSPKSDCREALLLLRKYARREVGFLQLRRALGKKSGNYSSWHRTELRKFAEVLVDIVQALPSYGKCVGQMRSGIMNAMKKKMQMITVKLPTWLIRELDTISQEMGVSRSELIRQILIDYVVGGSFQH